MINKFKYFLQKKNFTFLISLFQHLKYFKSYLKALVAIRTKDSVINYNKIFLKIPKGIRPVDYNIYYNNKYEKNEFKLISEYLNPNSSVLELGGGIGYISNVINKILKNKNNHIVLEGNELLINYLEVNKKLNNSYFQIVNGILSNKELNTFFVSETFVSSGLHNKSDNSKMTSVKGFNLQVIHENFKINFDTLIMDIEGAEYEILLENKILKSFKNIFFELHPKILSKSQQDEIYQALLSENFYKIDQSENVEFWKKS